MCVSSFHLSILTKFSHWNNSGVEKASVATSSKIQCVYSFDCNFMVFSLHAKCFRSLVTHLQWLPYEKWLTKRQPLFVNFDFRNVSFLHENCSWALLFLFPESSFFIPLNILQMQFDQMKTFHCIEKFNFLFTTKF